MPLDRIDPRVYNQFRGPYHQRALAAMEPLRKALGYEPHVEVIPDSQHQSLAPRATWDHRVSVPPGTWLWATSGSSQQPEGFSVQITDFASRTNLFSGLVNWNNITGQGSVSVPDATGAAVHLSTPHHIFNAPFPIVEPATLNVQLANLSANANQVQLVLWMLQPGSADGPRNRWNDELDATVNLWSHSFGLQAVAQSYNTGGQPGPSEDPALLAPAYTRSFSVQATNNVVVQGAPGYRIAIHQIAIYNTTEQTIQIMDGLAADLRGALTDFGVGGTDYLPYQSEPHFVLSDGNPFMIVLTPSVGGGGTGPVNGFLKYRLLRSWTPGQR